MTTYALDKLLSCLRKGGEHASLALVETTTDRPGDAFHDVAIVRTQNLFYPHLRINTNPQACGPCFALVALVEGTGLPLLGEEFGRDPLRRMTSAKYLRDHLFNVAQWSNKAIPTMPHVRYVSKLSLPKGPNFEDWSPQEKGWSSLGIRWINGAPALPEHFVIEQSDYGDNTDTLWQVKNAKDEVVAAVKRRVSVSGAHLSTSVTF